MREQKRYFLEKALKIKAFFHVKVREFKLQICRCKIDVLADLVVLNSRNIEFERVE